MIVVTSKGLNPITFKQGEDITINMPIVDNTNYPVDVSVCTDISATLKVNNNEYANYSLVARPNFGTIEVDTVYNNIIKLRVTRTQSKSFAVGNISIVLVLQFLTGSGDLETKEIPVIIGTVTTGLARFQSNI